MNQILLVRRMNIILAKIVIKDSNLKIYNHKLKSYQQNKKSITVTKEIYLEIEKYIK